MTEEEDIVFPSRKLWGWIPLRRRPLIISEGESGAYAITVGGNRIYFKDITDIEKLKWDYKMQYYPILITTEWGKKIVVDLGRYQIKVDDQLFEDILRGWQTARSE